MKNSISTVCISKVWLGEDVNDWENATCVGVQSSPEPVACLLTVRWLECCNVPDIVRSTFFLCQWSRFVLSLLGLAPSAMPRSVDICSYSRMSYATSLKYIRPFLCRKYCNFFLAFDPVLPKGWWWFYSNIPAAPPLSGPGKTICRYRQSVIIPGSLHTSPDHRSQIGQELRCFLEAVFWNDLDSEVVDGGCFEQNASLTSPCRTRMPQSRHWKRTLALKND